VDFAMNTGSSLFRLDGRTAVVIGAARGIGRACALGLADFGAMVVCADVNAAGSSATADAIRENHEAAESLSVDVTLTPTLEAALTRFGAPDVLVLTPSINYRKPLIETSEDEFDRVIDVNLKGVFRAARIFGRAMAERGSGSIIAFSSIRAQVVEPGQGVYAATKAATLQLLRVLATELGPRGVRVNAIAPGVVDTELTAPIRANQAWYDAYARKSILGRWASADEMIGACVFLASDASSYVTGSYLLVDGGWTAHDGRFTPPL
jgi:NAD(P)-dependent dehydrogenase (short-subunit alcohol dehydrogenase family)